MKLFGSKDAERQSEWNMRKARFTIKNHTGDYGTMEMVLGSRPLHDSIHEARVSSVLPVSRWSRLSLLPVPLCVPVGPRRVPSHRGYITSRPATKEGGKERESHRKTDSGLETAGAGEERLLETAGPDGEAGWSGLGLRLSWRMVLVDGFG
ncbi:unnamed protein product [Gadus morhua 'NCC']